MNQFGLILLFLFILTHFIQIELLYAQTTSQIKFIKNYRRETIINDDKGVTLNQDNGKAPAPADGKAPTPADGKAPTPADGKAPTPADGKAPEPAPADGKAPETYDGKAPAPADGIAGSVIEGIVGVMILIIISLFVFKKYKQKMKNNAILTPGDYENVMPISGSIKDKELPTSPREIFISNNDQTIASNSTRNHQNYVVIFLQQEQNIIQQLRQELSKDIKNEIANHIKQDDSSNEKALLNQLREEIQVIKQRLSKQNDINHSNESILNIDDEVINKLREEALQDIKQEIKQSLRNKVPNVNIYIDFNRFNTSFEK
ncbi:6905_t:CDS:2 [Funneliformis caledonium]|uniref:6905_t:CDS:1 n=1 Tax=Funneliformis caledonium TaxID=1117310 RepID=A0A9N9H9R8_9GLOM|nr:6905_t:CDS:2 [Funneliformis caledonium]